MNADGRYAFKSLSLVHFGESSLKGNLSLPFCQSTPSERDFNDFVIDAVAKTV